VKYYAHKHFNQFGKTLTKATQVRQTFLDTAYHNVCQDWHTTRTLQLKTDHASRQWSNLKDMH